MCSLRRELPLVCESFDPMTRTTEQLTKLQLRFERAIGNTYPRGPNTEILSSGVYMIKLEVLCSPTPNTPTAELFACQRDPPMIPIVHVPAHVSVVLFAISRHPYV